MCQVCPIRPMTKKPEPKRRCQKAADKQMPQYDNRDGGRHGAGVCEQEKAGKRNSRKENTGEFQNPGRTKAVRVCGGM